MNRPLNDTAQDLRILFGIPSLIVQEVGDLVEDVIEALPSMIPTTRNGCCDFSRAESLSRNGANDEQNSGW